MQRKEWFAVLGPFLLVFALDRIGKLFALALEKPIRVGVLELIYFENHGAMLGLFSELPSVLRIVSLSTGGAFLIVIFLTIQYLLPIQSLQLRAGMSALLGGIIGNVFDRIWYGYVIDFISLRSGSFRSPIFNIADMLQWVGYAMILVALIRNNHLLWPESERRDRLWINPEFQLRHAVQMLAVGMAVSLILGVFSYTYMKVTLIEILGTRHPGVDRFLLPFTITFLIVTLAAAGLLLVAGRFISHRIAGPIYAFQKYTREILSNSTERRLQLRKHDEFQELADLAEDLRQELQKSKTVTPVTAATQAAPDKTDAPEG